MYNCGKIEVSGILVSCQFGQHSVLLYGLTYAEMNVYFNWIEGRFNSNKIRITQIARGRVTKKRNKIGEHSTTQFCYSDFANFVDFVRWFCKFCQSCQIRIWLRFCGSKTSNFF